MSDNAIDFHDDRFMTSLNSNSLLNYLNANPDVISNCYDTNSKSFKERLNADCLSRCFI